jgi:hypothetical protein
MIHWIKESAERKDPALFAHARAALALKDKLTSPRGRLYREGPDGSFIPLD